MKKLFLITILSILVSCIDPDTKFTGYIVAKEFTPQRMSNENPKTIVYSGVITVPHTNTRSKPKKIDEKFVFYVANKDEILIKQVSENLFNSKKCGDKIIIKRYK